MNKKEFKIIYRKDISNSWSGTAYFVNRETGKTSTITIYARSGEKALAAKAFIRDHLNKRTPEFELANPGYVRVEVEEYEKYYSKRFKKTLA